MEFGILDMYLMLHLQKWSGVVESTLRKQREQAIPLDQKVDH